MAAVPELRARHPEPEVRRDRGRRDRILEDELGGRRCGGRGRLSDADVEDWQSSIDIVLRRFAEYHDLEGAFGRRALTERAKGVLMERHAIDEVSAFEMLRERSRSDNRKLIDLAAAVVDGHRLLPKQPQAPSQP
jgi:ANTAR domain